MPPRKRRSNIRSMARHLRSPIAGDCPRCGAAFSGIAGRIYCSPRCTRLASAARIRSARIAARVAAGLPQKGSTPGTCIACGAAFVGHRDKRFCSVKCESRWRARTPTEIERQRLKNRREREEHPERIRERARRRGPKAAAYRKAWARNNRDKVRAANARYRMRHRDRYRALQRKHYWTHRESRLMATRKWRGANLEKHAHVQAARRAREAQAVGSHTSEQWLLLCAAIGWRCVYCGAVGIPLTRDHMLPLRRGGSNDTSNIAPACKPCNCSKGLLTAEEFLERLAGD